MPISTIMSEPELGLACELALAEMHVDKALSMVMVRPLPGGHAAAIVTAGGAGSGTTSASSQATAAPSSTSTVTSTTAPITAPTSDTTKDSENSNVKPTTIEATVTTTAATTPAASVLPNRPSSSEDKAEQQKGQPSTESGRRRDMDAAAAEAAAMHLAAADTALLQLDPFFFTSSLEESGRGGRCGRRGDCDGDSDMLGVPWAFRVRWWWLKGVRARHAGDREQALEYFHRCERVLELKARDGTIGGKAEEKEEEEEGQAVVVLPYCNVHPRIDLQVSSLYASYNNIRVSMSLVELMLPTDRTAYVCVLLPSN